MILLGLFRTYAGGWESTARVTQQSKSGFIVKVIPKIRKI